MLKITVEKPVSWLHNHHKEKEEYSYMYTFESCRCVFARVLNTMLKNTNDMCLKQCQHWQDKSHRSADVEK